MKGCNLNNRNKLFCLNANTGELVKEFGKNGEIKVGLTPVPPVIYKNQLILITTSSILKVYDLNTGKLKWKYKIFFPVKIEIQSYKVNN